MLQLCWPDISYKDVRRKERFVSSDVRSFVDLSEVKKEECQTSFNKP